MIARQLDIDYFSEADLADALQAVTGSRDLAQLYAHESAKLWRGEVLDWLRLKRGIISKEELREARAARWQHADRHSYWLAQNLIKAGKVKAADDGSLAAHHIVSWYSKKANRARDMLRAVGLDIDHHSNGVWLPRFNRHTPHPAMFTAEPHSKTHTTAYYFNVEALMRGTMAEGLGRSGMMETLEEIAEDLTAGSFPLKTFITESMA
ncbi:MAG: AHH domain-containing protein [Gammaproteobacteria bacterium]|nr:AHH domain-containing protein [Gammaproteobacteria bacterium]